ncbi:DMT family transporter [Roseobacter sp. EG26]|uniref:DMT family transporter n=1 Tax=Roseobacter sp. EG26 TaxID=3412477 RepID=UPI003CE59F96
MLGFVRSASPSALIIAIGLLVGVSFTLSKYVAMSDVPAFLALFWQVAVASAALLGLLFATRITPPTAPRYIGYYLGAGLLGVSLPALIGYVVLEHITTGFYSALVTLSPMFTFAITAMVERRMLPLHRLLGLLIGFAGISLATLRGLDTSAIEPTWILLALSGPFVLASGNVFRSRVYPAGADPMALAAGTLFLQLALIGATLLVSGRLAEIAALKPMVFAAITGIGLITAISYALTFEVQRRTDGVGFSQVGYFATLSGITFGAIAFREELSLAFIAALLLIFLGLAITSGHLSRSHFRQAAGLPRFRRCRPRPNPLH